MSLLHEFGNVCVICHQDFINTTYKVVDVETNKTSFLLKQDLFNIKFPYTKRSGENTQKRKKNFAKNEQDYEELQHMVDHVKELFKVFQQEIKNIPAFKSTNETNTVEKNIDALEAATKIYNASGQATLLNIQGENQNDAVLVNLKDQNYLFPKNCKFFCNDILEIESRLATQKYDLILLDPPWWNKYIRRKRAKSGHSYNMMYDDDLNKIPLGRLLNDDGIVVVWCTNSMQHLKKLQGCIFDKWGVKFVGKWYWLKVTQMGEPVCKFADPPGKQPFEQIVFGCRDPEKFTKLPKDKLIVSVPSALHSHKPPLIELLQSYLPENPKCLEIFARYLLPNWTSWGFEAIRFQHESLYKKVL